MKNFNILIVEGNLKEENQNFLKAGIQTHTESLKNSLNGFDNHYNFDVINPSSDLNLDCLLYTSPSPRDLSTSRMPSSA